MELFGFFVEELAPCTIEWLKVGVFLGGDIFLGYLLYKVISEELKKG